MTPSHPSIAARPAAPRDPLHIVPVPGDTLWAQAWRRAGARAGARAALSWLALVVACAVFAPFLSSGHPIAARAIDAVGNRGPWSSPLVRHLTAIDVCLGAWGVGACVALAWPARRGRWDRLRGLASAFAQGAMSLGLLALGRALFEWPAAPRWAHAACDHELFPLIASVAAATATAILFIAVGFGRRGWRDARVLLVAALVASAAWSAWNHPLEAFPYAELEHAGRLEAVHAPNPFSPFQRLDGLVLAPPLTPSALAPAAPRVLCGTDALGRDVLSQLLHACRVAISIGLVSTGIATVLGVLVGAMMGYLGGWIDAALLRIVELFMALPVLFILIAATALLPRDTYVMMAVIGLCTWHGAARFTRAEFQRLRSADYIDAARAAGIPLRAVLFRHLLPNAATPVLVDAGFGVAAAILAEATLSYLGLGPERAATWGRLLADATNQSGGFVWWLAVYPGAAIFLTALSYNAPSESLRLSLDPRAAPPGRPRTDLRYDPGGHR